MIEKILYDFLPISHVSGDCTETLCSDATVISKFGINITNYLEISFVSQLSTFTGFGFDLKTSLRGCGFTTIICLILKALSSVHF